MLNEHHVNTTGTERLSPTEAAAYVGVSLSTLRRWTLKEGLRVYRLGKRLFYRRSDLDALFKADNP